MKAYVRYQKLMGTAFSLGVVCNSETFANELLDKGIAEIKRIESLLTEYQDHSTTSKINRQTGGVPLDIGQEVFALIKRCQDISKLTQGCFDITASSLKRLYTFENDTIDFPNKDAIKQALSLVGINQLKLNANTLSITKQHKDTTISFNAIGKGYASEMVKKLWQSEGIASGFVNASGDLCGFGSKADGKPWQIGIANPEHRDKPILFVPITNQAIATSGDYEQYFIHDDKRYSHNINPLTGMPLSGIKSVSIISPNAELSDALATAVYVMGVKKGIPFVNQLPKTSAIIIDENNQVHLSKKLSYEANRL